METIKEVFEFSEDERDSDDESFRFSFIRKLASALEEVSLQLFYFFQTFNAKEVFLTALLVRRGKDCKNSLNNLCHPIDKLCHRALRSRQNAHAKKTVWTV